MQKNDNRNYKFGKNSSSDRGEYPLIEKWIKQNSSVIDLGAGDGSLLKRLLINKHIQPYGIEISKSGINSASEKGIELEQGRIDVKLPYKNKQFDYAICNVTIQMVMYPEILLKEMHRISKQQIVTFPNFAFILNRLELLFKGRMPQTMIPGYEWYSTGHIHQLSINDYREFCLNNHIQIKSENHIFPQSLFGSTKVVLRNYPNLFASTAVFLTK